MRKGFDTASQTGNMLDDAKAAGMDFVGRYYSPSTWKNLTAAEAQAISDAGMTILPVWEVNASPGRFSYDYGVSDAKAAQIFGEALGQPAGTAIYFAVDFDADPTMMAERIIPYFRGVKVTLAGYEIGVYGSGFVLTTLRDQRLATWLWLAGAGGWRGSRNFEGWHVRQYPPTNYGWGEIDPCDGQDEFGGWSLPRGAVRPPPPETRPTLRRGSQGQTVAVMQEQLQACGYRRLGTFGDETDEAVRGFQADQGLTVDGVVGPQTWAALDKATAAAVKDD